jgi:hypothetical protein
MRRHQGMRPQDIVILLKIIVLAEKDWLNKDLAQSLYISGSEIGESLARSEVAGLIDYTKKRVNRQGLFEFLEHGLHYVFPQQPGAMMTGVPTAHAHPFIKQFIDSEFLYVWPDFNGKSRGLSIEPLYPNQVKAIREDPELYKALALLDVIRVGRVREIDIAITELRNTILYESQQELGPDQSRL